MDDLIDNGWPRILIFMYLSIQKSIFLAVIASQTWKI